MCVSTHMHCDKIVFVNFGNFSKFKAYHNVKITEFVSEKERNRISELAWFIGKQRESNVSSLSVEFHANIDITRLDSLYTVHRMHSVLVDVYQSMEATTLFRSFPCIDYSLTCTTSNCENVNNLSHFFVFFFEFRRQYIITVYIPASILKLIKAEKRGMDREKRN